MSLFVHYSSPKGFDADTGHPMHVFLISFKFIAEIFKTVTQTIISLCRNQLSHLSSYMLIIFYVGLIVVVIILLRIQEVQTSVTGSKSGYPDMFIMAFFSRSIRMIKRLSSNELRLLHTISFSV
jgi:hypothetical protein